MRTVSQFWRRTGSALVLAVMSMCIPSVVNAETVQFSMSVTEIYPEMAAGGIVLNGLESVQPGPSTHEQSENATHGDRALKPTDYAEVLGRQFSTEAERRKYDLSDIQVHGFVSEINFRNHGIGVLPLFVHYPDEEDLDRLTDYGENVLWEAVDETIQEIGWLDGLENRLKSFFKYELFLKGTEERDYSNREFEWEDRKETLRQEETTTVQTTPPAGRRSDAYYGVTLLNVGIASGSFVEPPSAYARWEKLPGIDKIKVKVQPMEEVSVSFRDSINKRWYWQNKAELDDSFDPKVRFSLTRRDEIRRNRITFFTEFGHHARVGITFGALL